MKPFHFPAIKQNRIFSPPCMALATAALFALPTQVLALELSASLASDLEYSNNVTFKNKNKLDDFVHSVGMDLGIVEQRKDFQANANFGLKYEHYYSNTFSDQSTLESGIGLVNFDLVEQFLNWQSSFSRTQVLIDRSATDTPDNRKHRDILRTGPSINYAITEATRLGLSSTYVNIENSNPDVSDSQRVNGDASVNHTFNTLTDLNIGASYSDTLEPDEGSDYTSVKYNAGFVRRFSHGEASFQFGRSRVSPKGEASTSGNFFDIKINREQVYSHQVFLGYNEDISDSVIGFTTDETTIVADDGTLVPVTIIRGGSTTDTLKRKHLDLGASREVGNFLYAATLFWEKEAFVIQNNEERSRGLNLRLDEKLSQELSVGYEFNVKVNDFVDQPGIGKDRTNHYLVDSRYEVSQDLSLNASMGYVTRTNNTQPYREYEEFSLGLGVKWVIY